MTDQTFAQRAKNYLSQIQKTNQLIQRLTETAGTLRSRLTSPRSAGRSDGGRASGPKDSLGEAAARLMDLEGEIDRRINTLVAQKSDALSRIWKIPDQDQKNILIARYVNGVKWERIALELNFSIRQVHRIHGAALVDFAEKNSDILKDGTLCHTQP